jgi:hypothetical protein
MTEYPKDLDGLRWEKDDGKKAGYLFFDRPPVNTISFEGRSQIALRPVRYRFAETLPICL